MGVRINGVWHEELADPGTGGEDSGGGRNFSSGEQYNAVSSSQPAGFWGENLDTHYDATPTAPGTPTNTTGAGQVGSAIDQMLKAIADGNKQAFEETVRQWNLVFGLDTKKFEDDVRRFNENLAISQAGLTGTYQGAPTQQAIAQNEAIAQARAGLTGYYQQPGQMVTADMVPGPNGTLVPRSVGQPTMALQQQQYAQQMGAIEAAAKLQANPFRQAQVIGQLGNLLRGQAVAGFQAPGQAQGQTDFSGMGNMQRLIDDIRGGAGAINSQSTQSVLDAIPTPNKVNSVQFMRSSPLTQNIILQGIQEKYGMSPDDALAQIKNTLPSFQSPTTFGSVKR